MVTSIEVKINKNLDTCSGQETLVQLRVQKTTRSKQTNIVYVPFFFQNLAKSQEKLALLKDIWSPSFYACLIMPWTEGYM
jgi:hypothetical protein